MDRLFFLVFRNNYLRKLIFSFVSLINLKKFNKNKIFKYHQIKNIDWICTYEKWMLLKDMLNNKVKFKVTENALITICKLVTDFKLFQDIYNGLREEFKQIDFMFIDYAASAGSLEIVKLLHNQGHCATFRAIDNAAWKGHKEIVQFLLDNRKENCSRDAIDGAAENGFMDIVELLTKRTNAGCSKSAMNLAAKNGNLQMVQYLYLNRTEGASTKALDYCCQFGHLDIYKFLYENDILSINNFNTLRYNNNSNSNSNNSSSSNNSNNINNKSLKNSYITDEGLRYAVTGGHFDIVKYLLDNQLFNQKELNQIFKDSLYQKNLEIIKLLEKYTSSEKFTKTNFLEFLNRAISNELINNINYLFDEFNHKLTLKEFKRLVTESCRYSNIEIFKNIYNRAIKSYPALNSICVCKLNNNNNICICNNDIIASTTTTTTTTTTSSIVTKTTTTISSELLQIYSSPCSTNLRYDKNELNFKKLFMFAVKRLDVEKSKFIFEIHPLRDINNIALSYSIYSLNIPLSKFLIENIFKDTFIPDNYLKSPIIIESKAMYHYLLSYKSENQEKLNKLQLQQSSPQYLNSKVIFIVNNEDFRILSVKYFDEFHVMNTKLYKPVLENVSSKLIMYSKRRHHICNR